MGDNNIPFLEGSVQSIRTFLVQALVDEARLLVSVRDDVDLISNELNSMSAFLSSASQTNDGRMKQWVMQVRDLAYDAEDCIDHFIVVVGQPRGTGFIDFFSSIPHFFTTLITRHQIGVRIKEIRRRTKDARERANRFVAVPSGSLATRVDPHLSANYVGDSELVGIDGPRELLISRLLAEETRLSIISVVGMGGLGKTAVVQRASNDGRVKKRFQCRAWVAVSQYPETKSILRQMVKSFFPVLSHPQVNGMEVDELIGELREFLQDKSYVVVFDDMWNLEAWNSIKFALPDNHEGSRVIVTTQIEWVGKNCSARSHDSVYKLPPLTDNLARDLFCKIVFGPDQSCPENLEELTEGILKKCDGLPRAIVTISRVLAIGPKTPEEWQRLHDHLYSVWDTDPNLKRMKRILTYCYDYLPYHLKFCFLYLSIFPKKSKIRRKRLVRRFMAEGLVNSGGHRKLAEEVAERYFDEFISRNIIQPLEIGADGKVKTCQIQVVMHEIIVSKSIEEKFAYLLSEHYAVADHKVRHLSVHDGTSQKPCPSLSCVRSLTMLQYNGRLLATSGPFLRVLDLEGCESLKNDDLQRVCTLYLLRYLSLRKTPITLLPEAIGELRYLQTLDVKDTDVAVMPASIGKMQQLSYLLAGKSVGHKKQEGAQLQNGIGNVKTLLALALVDANQSLTELGELTKLRKLGLVGLKREREGELSTALQKLDNSLRSLSVWNSDHTETLEYMRSLPKPPRYLQNLKLGGYLGMLPQWFAKLHNVMKMTLRGTGLNDEGMLALQNLQSLVQLILMDDAYAGNELRTSEDGFPSLKELHMKNLTELRRVEISERAAPNLQKLILSHEVDIIILGNRTHSIIPYEELQIYHITE